MKPLRLLASLSLILLPAAWARSEIIERVLVKVNGDIVSMSEFETRQLAAVQSARIGPDKVEAYLRENNAKILQEAVDELLLVQRASEIDLKVRPEYVKDVIDGIKKENHLDSDQALLEQLRKEGLAMEDLKRNIERSILRHQVVAREVEGRVSVSEADARADYNAHAAEYRHAGTVHLQEIVVKAADAALAKDIMTRARGGEDFTALARAHSIARTRESGGDLGTLASGEMNADLEKVAFALEPGAVSEPVTTTDGLRILRLVAKTPEKIVPFDEVKPERIKQLSQERLAQEYEKYLAKLRASASITYKVKEVPLQITGPGAAAAPGVGVSPTVTGLEEITTTTQAAPERVVPAAAPGLAPPEAQKPDQDPENKGKKDEKKDPSKPPGP